MIILLHEILEEGKLLELSKGIGWEEFKSKCSIKDSIAEEGKGNSVLYLVDYQGLYLSIAVKDEKVDFFVIRCWNGKTEGIEIFDESIGQHSINSLDAWLAYLRKSPQKWSVHSPPSFEKAMYLRIGEKKREVVFEFDEDEGNNYGFQYIDVK